MRRLRTVPPMTNRWRPGWGLGWWSPIAAVRIGQHHPAWCRPQALVPTPCASALSVLDGSMLAVRTDTAHRITWAHRLPGSVMTPEQPQSLPAKNMQVSVEHRPSSIFTGVEHQPIPTLRDPGITRNRSTSNNHLSQQGRRGRSQRQRVLMMLNRHHQHMNPSLRIDVQHSQGRRGPMHHGSRHIPRNDLAKQTVSHNTHTQDPSVARRDGLPDQANFESRPLYAELKVHHPAHSYRNGLCCKPLRYRKETCQSPPKHTTLLRKRMHQHTEPRRTKGDHRKGGPGGEAPPAGGLGAWPPISTGAATPSERFPRAWGAQGWLRRGEVWGLLHRDAACAGPR